MVVGVQQGSALSPPDQAYTDRLEALAAAALPGTE